MNSVEKPMQLNKGFFFFFLNLDGFTSPASTATRGWKHINCLLVHCVWKATGQAAEEHIDILLQFFWEEN